jgi:hypothetical protein
MVALALVLGGTAVAASTVDDKTADTKLIKKLAPTLSVKNAKTVNGQTVQKIQWKVAPGTTPQTIFTAAGLAISGSCDADSNIAVDATGSAANNGELRVFGNANGTEFSKNIPNFDSGKIEPLDSADGAHNEGSGQLVYATYDGHVLTLDYGFDWGQPIDGAYDGRLVGCTFYGIATFS